jgi:uncharacterized membrane protein YhhN
MPIGLLVLAAILLCIYVPLRVKGRIRIALLLKTTISLLFMLTAFWAVAHLGSSEAVGSEAHNTGLTIFLFCVPAGLLSGLLGDIWLDLKDTHPDHRQFYMFAGFSCFLLGHLFYCVGLVAAFAGGNLQVLIWPLVFGVALGAGLLLLEKPMRLHYGSYRTIVTVYTVVLAATTLLPLLLAFGIGGAPVPGSAGSYSLIWLLGTTSALAVPLLFGIGMVAFLLSDFVLSQTYFAQKAVPDAVFMPLNYLLYYGGQFCIASSLYLLLV